MERVCPNCGYVNRSAGIFCAKCGKRLTEEAVFVASRPPFNLFRVIVGLIQLAITIGIFVVIAQLLLPPAIPPPVSDAQAVSLFNATVERLLDAVEDGRSATETISDYALNAYLADRVAAAGAEQAEGLRVGLRQIRVDFEQDRAKVTADTVYGPVRIVMAVTVRPEGSPEGLSLKVEKTQVGRLSIPVRYGRWVVDKIRSTVEGLERERELLNRTRLIRLQKGAAQVLVGPS